jgi:hypothetical protein
MTGARTKGNRKAGSRQAEARKNIESSRKAGIKLA